jgi:hypothetical protein
MGEMGELWHINGIKQYGMERDLIFFKMR